MNTSQLECFVTLANSLNFMRTADILGLTQPAVTKQIKALESELGAELFYRSSRAVSLTPVGEQFLSEANDMLNIYIRSKSWIGSYKHESRNPLRIGYSDPLVMQVLSVLLKRFVDQYPDLQITPELVLDQTDANLNRLQKGKLDCVFTMKDSKFSDSDIKFSGLQNCGFLCSVSKSHPIAASYIDFPHKPLEIHTEEIWAYRQIIAIPPYLLKKYFSRGRSLLPVNDSLDNIICSDINEAYALVLSGIGYAMIPEYLNVGHPDVLYLKWAESRHAPFGIYYMNHISKSSPVYNFICIVEKYYRER